MLVTDFDYDLPQELIAQHPMEPRDIRACWLLTKRPVKLSISIFMIW